MRVVGFLGAGSSGILREPLAALGVGLKELGYVENQNLVIEYRFAEGQSGRTPSLLSDLVRRKVEVLVTASQGARIAKEVAPTMPVVFVSGEDPLSIGLVSTLNRPGGNATGVYMFTSGLEAKRLGLLHEMVPKAKTIAVLINPSYGPAQDQLGDVHEASTRLGMQLVIANASAESDIDLAFKTFVQSGAQALLVCASPFFNVRRQQLVVLATRHAIPAIYEWHDFANAGGLMSYGTSLSDAYRQMGVYTGRILNGEKPSDLPVVQTTKFEFVINLGTAKALGIEVSPTLSARADRIIE